MAIVVTVAGVTKSILAGSLRITEPINERATASLVIDSLDGSYRPGMWDELIITEDGTRIFGGIVQSAPERSLNMKTAPIRTSISATGFAVLTDKRYASFTIVAGSTLEDALGLCASYVATHGVNVHPSQVTGPTFTTEIVYKDRLLTEVLNDLASLTGYSWTIDFDKYLRMSLPEDTAAPFSLTAGDGNAIGDVVVEPTRENYANRIILLWTAVAEPAYAYWSPTAFVNNDTVKIGSITYTFKTTLTAPTTANEVLIAAGDATTTLGRLANAIEKGTGGGTTYGSDTAKNEGAFLYMVRAGVWAIRAREAGTAGNSIAVVGTGGLAAFAFYTEGGGTVTTLVLGKAEALVNRVEANDTADQSPPPLHIIERLVTRPDIKDGTIAQQFCDAELYVSRAEKTKKIVRYVTDNAGIHPGMRQTITLAFRGLSGSFIVTDVSTSMIGARVFRSVTAQYQSLQAQVMLLNRWQNDAKRIFGGKGGSSTGVSSVVSSIGSGTSGTSTTTLSSELARIELGGSRQWGVPSASYINAPEYIDQILNSDAVPSTARFQCHQRTQNAATSVQVRVVAVDASGSVLSVCAESTASTNTGWGAGEAGHYVDVAFTPRAGINAYRLQVKGSNATWDVFVAGAHIVW